MKKIINIIISAIMVICSLAGYILFIAGTSKSNTNITYSSTLSYYLIFNIVISIVFLVLSFFKAGHKKLIIPALYLVVISFLVVNSTITYSYSSTPSYINYYPSSASASSSQVTESLTISLPTSYTLLFYILVLGFFANTLLADKIGKKVSAYINIFIFVYLAVKLFVTNLSVTETFGSKFGSLATSYTIVISTLVFSLIYSIFYQLEIINPTTKKAKKIKEDTSNE